MAQKTLRREVGRRIWCRLLLLNHPGARAFEGPLHWMLKRSHITNPVGAWTGSGDHAHEHSIANAGPIAEDVHPGSTGKGTPGEFFGRSSTYTHKRNPAGRSHRDVSFPFHNGAFPGGIAPRPRISGRPNTSRCARQSAPSSAPYPGRLIFIMRSEKSCPCRISRISSTRGGGMSPKPSGATGRQKSGSSGYYEDSLVGMNQASKTPFVPAQKGRGTPSSCKELIHAARGMKGEGVLFSAKRIAKQRPGEGDTHGPFKLIGQGKNRARSPAAQRGPSQERPSPSALPKRQGKVSRHLRGAGKGTWLEGQPGAPEIARRHHQQNPKNPSPSLADSAGKW